MRIFHVHTSYCVNLPMSFAFVFALFPPTSFTPVYGMRSTSEGVPFTTVVRDVSVPVKLGGFTLKPHIR